MTNVSCRLNAIHMSGCYTCLDATHIWMLHMCMECNTHHECNTHDECLLNEVHMMNVYCLCNAIRVCMQCNTHDERNTHDECNTRVYCLWPIGYRVLSSVHRRMNTQNECVLCIECSIHMSIVYCSLSLASCLLAHEYTCLLSIV